MSSSEDGRSFHFSSMRGRTEEERVRRKGLDKEGGSKDR